REYSKSVMRINYGTAFVYRKRDLPVSDVYRHVFEIALPQKFFEKEQDFLDQLKLSESETKSLCMSGQSEGHYTEKSGLSSCRRFERHIAYLLSVARKGYSVLNMLTQDIFDLLPENLENSPTAPPGRKGRAWFGGIGNLLKSVIGTATEQDILDLNKNILAINDYVGKSTNSTQKLFDDMTSYVQLTNDRMDKLVLELGNRSLKTLKLIERVDRDSNLLIDYVANITLHQLRLQSSINDLTLFYTNFLSAIETLATGHLPSFFFQESTIQNMLTDTRKAIAESGDRFLKIIHPNAHYFYSAAKFVCSRNKDKLFVQINIPLSRLQDTFHFYRIHTFAIPISDKQPSHVSQIKDLPLAIAISIPTGLYFIPDIMELEDLEPKHDTEVQRVYHTIDPITCVIAIFLDRQQDIKTKCSFVLIPDAVKSAVHHIEKDYFFLININSFDLDCSDHTEKKTGCVTCLLKIPPFCSMATGDFYIPKTSSTQQLLEGSTTLHTINMAVLINLFDPKEIQQLAGDSKFDKPPLLEHPNFNLFESNIKDSLVADEREKLNLQKAAEAVRADKTILMNLQQAIITGDATLETNFFFTTPGIFLQTLTILVSLLILHNLYITYKLKQALLTLAIMNAKLTNVECQNDTFFLRYLKPTTLTKTSFGENFQNFANAELLETVSNHINFLIFIIVLLCLTLVLLKVLKKRRQQKLGNHFFYLEFSNPKAVILIKFFTLTLASDTIYVSADQLISDIRISGFLLPKLVFDWNSLKMQGFLTRHTGKMRNRISISYAEAKILREMIAKSFTVKLVQKLADRFVEIRINPVQLEPPELNQLRRSTSEPKLSRVTFDTNPTYMTNQTMYPNLSNP
ncbi:MAG: hypothetical protein ACHQ1D_07850, partial [Nitrososphaerales archaeon]